jgi:hypothetical protein
MISSQNPIEEIMNVYARQIPNGSLPKDWELRITSSLRLLRRPMRSTKVKIPAQAELERGTLEGWDERRNSLATSC